MSNFGFVKLRAVNPYEASFHEARSAVGAAPLLKEAETFPTVAEAVADCELVVGTTAARNRELHQPLKTLPEAAPILRKRLGSGRVALLFGSEKRGLSNADLSHCHWLLRIPTREGHASMNLGQAVAVCLYELTSGRATERARSTSPARESNKLPPARAAELERITSLLLEALQASGYLRKQTEVKEEKIRRMVRRLDLSAADAEVWLGMLRQIVWKLGSG